MMALQIVMDGVVFGFLAVLFEYGFTVGRREALINWTKPKLCRASWLITSLWVLAFGASNQFLALVPLALVASSHLDLVARTQAQVTLTQLVDNVGPALRRHARRFFGA